jgi:hypothetical protein
VAEQVREIADRLDAMNEQLAGLLRLLEELPCRRVT